LLLMTTPHRSSSTRQCAESSTRLRPPHTGARQKVKPCLTGWREFDRREPGLETIEAASRASSENLAKLL
jgi:hypothetical protein